MILPVEGKHFPSPLFSLFTCIFITRFYLWCVQLWRVSVCVCVCRKSPAGPLSIPFSFVASSLVFWVPFPLPLLCFLYSFPIF